MCSKVMCRVILITLLLRLNIFSNNKLNFLGERGKILIYLASKVTVARTGPIVNRHSIWCRIWLLGNKSVSSLTKFFAKDET